MLKQAQLAGITITLVVASTAGGILLWWQSTPQFALLEARKGFVSKERKRFNTYVDVATLTTEFTEELIFAPAEKTPGLTKIQRLIGLGALKSTRTKIDNSLIFQVQNLVGGAANSSSEIATAGSDPVSEPAEDSRPKKFTSLFRRELKKEKERMKNAVLEKMSEYARMHPDDIISRIFSAPRGHRASAVKELLAECGFKGSNFKTYRLERKGHNCVTHLTFHSPRINDLVTVKLEMERVREGVFGRYRIVRLVDFKRTLNDLKYDTDQQIQGLVAYGLHDLNGHTLAGQAKAVLKGLGEHTDDDDDGGEEGRNAAGVKPAPEKLGAARAMRR